MDAGLRVLGEVAFGLNYEIDRFTRNILFDEKIGGTMHLALGSGFPQSGGQNTSGLHWDMICDLRREGEVYADGELIWKNGQFLAEPALEVVESGQGHEPRVSFNRLERLADVLVGYCTRVRTGDLVCVDSPAAAPLVEAVWRRVLEAGDTRIFGSTLTARPSSSSGRGPTSSWSWVSPLRRAEVERADVRIAIYADVNTRANGGVDPERQARLERRHDPIRRIHLARVGSGDLRGVVTLYPTQAAAQDADMSRRSTRTSSSAPALLDHDDPRGAWEALGQACGGSPSRLGRERGASDRRRRHRPHARRRGTDVGAERRAGELSGRRGLHRPDRDEVDGTISFTYPSSYAGRRISGVQLEFRGGEVVRADAEEGETFCARCWRSTRALAGPGSLRSA